MPCLSYCYMASPLDPKPFKQVIAFWFPSTSSSLSMILQQLANELLLLYQNQGKLGIGIVNVRV